jgi:hypothetical protein
MVELQTGQPVQVQFKEMHPVLSTIPDAGGIAGREQRGPRRQADLLGQFTPCRRLGRFARPDPAAR